jgi:hypothetical protein
VPWRGKEITPSPHHTLFTVKLQQAQPCSYSQPQWRTNTDILCIPHLHQTDRQTPGRRCEPHRRSTSPPPCQRSRIAQPNNGFCVLSVVKQPCSKKELFTLRGAYDHMMRIPPARSVPYLLYMYRVSRTTLPNIIIISIICGPASIFGGTTKPQQHPHLQLIITTVPKLTRMRSRIPNASYQHCHD